MCVAIQPHMRRSVSTAESEPFIFAANVVSLRMSRTPSSGIRMMTAKNAMIVAISPASPKARIRWESDKRRAANDMPGGGVR